MKANNSSFFASYTVYVDTGKFQTTNKTVFASQGFSGLGFMTFCKKVKPIFTFQVKLLKTQFAASLPGVAWSNDP